MELFDFNANSDLKNWQIINDDLMGWKSHGHLEINYEGNAFFFDKLSKENNGGFSSVRYCFDKTDVSEFSKVAIHLKGDKKQYQVRTKSDTEEMHGYGYKFKSNGDWQTIEVPFNKMFPTFRGRKLDIPKYNGNTMQELTFLIADSQEGIFRLKIDKITLE